MNGTTPNLERAPRGYVCYIPFCLWPDVQESILGDRAVHGDGLSLDLDEAACARIVDWRLGWTALEKHLDALDFVETSPPDVTIVDFSSVQADGGAGLREKLRLSVFAGASRIRRRGGRSSGAPTRSGGTTVVGRAGTAGRASPMIGRRRFRSR